jgi:hypothetical protein
MLWRDPRWTGLLMVGYFVLSLAVGPDGFFRAHTRPVGLGTTAFGALAAAFFAWRVTRGGRVARMLLIVSTGVAFAATAFEIAPRFGPVVFAALVASAAQLALLLTPAVYQRTRARGWVGPTGWTRVRPPAALLLFGVLAGLVVTLLSLSHVGTPRPGCGAGDAGRVPTIGCLPVGDGYPLRWLAAYHSALVVDWGAVLKDWSQYTVVSGAVLYGGWLGPRTRQELAPARIPAGAIVGSVLAGLTLSAATGGVPLTWVTANSFAPLFNQPALLADTALWSLVALCGCLVVRVLMRPPSGRPKPSEPVKPADDARPA